MELFSFTPTELIGKLNREVATKLRNAPTSESESFEAIFMLSVSTLCSSEHLIISKLGNLEYLMEYCLKDKQKLNLSESM